MTKHTARTEHAAILTINLSTLLKFLDYEGGEVIRLNSDSEFYHPNCIQMVVSHPDLPEVHMGDLLTHIDTRYILSKASKIGLRTFPPKK